MPYPPTLEMLTDKCRYCGSNKVQRVRFEEWLIHCYACGCNSPLPNKKVNDTS